MIRWKYKFGVTPFGLAWLELPLPDVPEILYKVAPAFEFPNRTLYINIEIEEKYGALVPCRPREEMDRKFLEAIIRRGKLMLIDGDDSRKQLLVGFTKRARRQMRDFINMADRGMEVGWR